jgi:putative oxidoreductase
MNSIDKQPSVLSLTGRVLLAAIFLISGLGKLAAPATTAGYIASTGLPFASLGVALAIAVEVAGSLLLIFGWQTRIVALALAAFSIATGVLFHNAVGDQNQFIHLLKNLAIAGGLLQVAGLGAGAFSIDAARQSRALPKAI